MHYKDIRLIIYTHHILINTLTLDWILGVPSNSADVFLEIYKQRDNKSGIGRDRTWSRENRVTQDGAH